MERRGCTVSKPIIDIRRSGERFRTRLDWLDSYHSFSFANHYDPANTHHGLLLVSNDDIVAPRTGFDTHPHQDMEIVTWVIQGALAHRDSSGGEGVLRPGEVQTMTAGTGIVHSEYNASATEPVSTRSSKEMTSALMKPFWKSVWITPAASGAVAPFLMVQARLSLGPAVR